MIILKLQCYQEKCAYQLQLTNNTKLDLQMVLKEKGNLRDINTFLEAGCFKKSNATMIDDRAVNGNSLDH